jgi:hypothetical protein
MRGRTLSVRMLADAQRMPLMSTAVHVLQRVPSAAAAADGLRKDASTLRFFFFLSIRVKNSSLAERFPAVRLRGGPRGSAS